MAAMDKIQKEITTKANAEKKKTNRKSAFRLINLETFLLSLVR